MKRYRILVAALMLISTSFVFSQTDRPKLSRKEIDVQRVNFQNRTRRRSPSRVRINQIAIGRALARRVVANEPADRAGFVIERIFNADAKEFGADIARLKSTSNYGHINHIRRILTGYLMQAFEYNQSDAALIARLVLYYNARQRGRFEDFKNKYSEQVSAKIVPTSLGIDRSYRRWPGRTQIVIPLVKNLVRPGGTTVNPAEIRKNSGNISPGEIKRLDDITRRRQREDRKKLIEVKKTLDDKKTKQVKKADEINKKLIQTDKKINQLKKDPVKNKAEIKKTEVVKKKLEDDKKKVVNEIKKTDKKIEDVNKEIKKTTEDPAKKEDPKTTDDPGKKTTDAPVAKKDEPKKDEPKKTVAEITKDIKKDADKKSKNVVENKILFLRVLQFRPGGHYNNELWTIDVANKDALARGPFTQICGRRFVVTKGAETSGILVIGYLGEAHDDTEHHLIMLNKDTLQREKVSKEFLHWRSPLLYLESEGKIYAFEQKDGKVYLARFDGDLKLEARSDKAISPNSDITFFEQKIYLTGKAETGSKATTIMVFNREDLKHTKTIEPPK